jgi:hypothetical protein
MNTQHTPGPWNTPRTFGLVEMRQTAVKNGHNFAVNDRRCDSCGVQLDDAAAIPCPLVLGRQIAGLLDQRADLLAALRTAHYYLHDAKRLPEAGAGVAETLRAVDAAIAKAEGV